MHRPVRIRLDSTAHGNGESHGCGKRRDPPEHGRNRLSQPHSGRRRAACERAVHDHRGSGPYAGASGGGTLTSLSNGPSGTGIDTWTGTLVVPGVQFDLTAPTIEGAVDKKVRVARRAKRVRVAYTVTAKDDVDGPVRVTCLPRSGSTFAVGRTRVKCSPTDTSGNSGTATFTVTVTRRR
jgi:HYR domain